MHGLGSAFPILFHPTTVPNMRDIPFTDRHQTQHLCVQASPQPLLVHESLADGQQQNDPSFKASPLARSDVMRITK